MNNIKLNTSNIPHKDGNKDNTPALQKLKILAVEHKRMKYPNLPDHAIPITKYKDNTANGLTRCIIDYLKFNGQQAERISTTGRYIDNRRTITDVIGYKKVIGSGKWIPTSGKKGSADISSTIRGRSVKIEVKIGRDKQSKAQKIYQEQIERSGGIYYIARNFQTFYEWYTSTFEKGRACLMNTSSKYYHALNVGINEMESLEISIEALESLNSRFKYRNRDLDDVIEVLTIAKHNLLAVFESLNSRELHETQQAIQFWKDSYQYSLNESSSLLKSFINPVKENQLSYGRNRTIKG